MFNLKKMSLRARLLWSMTTVLVVSMSLVTLSNLRSGREALKVMSSEVSTLSEELQQKQSTALADVEKKQTAITAVAQGAVRAKAESLAGFAAKLAPVPLLTFDGDVLDEYCEQACTDSDVVFSYIMGKSSKLGI